jgi:hypothetical protein
MAGATVSLLAAAALPESELVDSCDTESAGGKDGEDRADPRERVAT